MNRQLAVKFLDSYKRKFFIKNEIKQKYLNHGNNKVISQLELEQIKFSKKSSSNFFKKSKFNSFCLNSGRSYNISKKIKLSRFDFKKSLKNGNLSSFSKF